MPRTSSAKKALRQSDRRRILNTNRKINVKNEVKEFKKLIEAKKFDEARAAFPKVMKTVDKVAKSGFIKKGKADRIKSRLAKKIKNASS